MTVFFYDYLPTRGINPEVADFLTTAILSALAIVLSIIANNA